MAYFYKGNVDWKNNSIQRIGYATIVVFAIAFIIFASFLLFSVSTDIQRHAQWVSDVVHGLRTSDPNFLYPLSIYLFSFFSKEYIPLYFGSVLVLSIAVSTKYLLSLNFIVDTVAKSDTRSNILEEKQRDLLAMIASGMLIFVFCVPLTMLLGGHIYLTNFPPNVWHNPTTIFVMPFVILLFWESYKQIRTNANSRIGIITVLSIANVLSKPSFFFVFCIVYPIFLLLRYQFKKEFWLNLIPVMLGAILVLAEYYFLYGFSRVGRGVGISLFEVWSYYSPSIPLAFAGSVFFPLVFIIFYWKDLLKNDLFKYSASLFVVAVIMFSALIETGDRRYDGNFGWQYIITNYILYLTITKVYLKKLIENNQSGTREIISIVRASNWKDKVLFFVFTYQFLLGVYYVLQLFI